MATQWFRCLKLSQASLALQLACAWAQTLAALQRRSAPLQPVHQQGLAHAPLVSPIPTTVAAHSPFVLGSTPTAGRRSCNHKTPASRLSRNTGADSPVLSDQSPAASASAAWEFLPLYKVHPRQLKHKHKNNTADSPGKVPEPTLQGRHHPMGACLVQSDIGADKVTGLPLETWNRLQFLLKVGTISQLLPQ